MNHAHTKDLTVAFLEELYALPDERPVLTSGRAAEPNHDDLYGKVFWFSLQNHLRRLWAVGRGARR
jgi:hypothetical protein